MHRENFKSAMAVDEAHMLQDNSRLRIYSLFRIECHFPILSELLTANLTKRCYIPLETNAKFSNTYVIIDRALRDFPITAAKESIYQVVYSKTSQKPKFFSYARVHFHIIIRVHKKFAKMSVTRMLLKVRTGTKKRWGTWVGEQKGQVLYLKCP